MEKSIGTVDLLLQASAQCHSDEKTTHSNALKATFLDGRGKRPPEDVGGPWGYTDKPQIQAFHDYR